MTGIESAGLIVATMVSAAAGFVAGIFRATIDHAAHADATKQRKEQRLACAHDQRGPYQSTRTLGDESDYQSWCVACGAILRDPPNVPTTAYSQTWRQP